MIIYLDYAATTPVDSRVLKKMMPFFSEYFANSGSTHRLGEFSKQQEEVARQEVAKVINAQASEIIFTSGATESNNLAIRGMLQFYDDKQHWISINTLHKSIRDIDRRITNNTVLSVQKTGLIDLEELEKAITSDTLLVATSIVCSETGVMENIKEIAKICKRKGVFLHCDIAQGFGKIPIDIKALDVDTASISGHKIYGPKGIGALYIRGKNPRIKLRALIYGGGQERGLRNGTLPTPLIIGLGEAARLAFEEQDKLYRHIQEISQLFITLVKNKLQKIYINGGVATDQIGILNNHYPGIVNISFAGIEGEALMGEMHDVCISSGSACTSDSLESSYVLKALGVKDDLAHTSLRFSFGKDTTREEVIEAVDKLVIAVDNLRAISPLWDMIEEGIDLNKIKWKD